MIKENDHDTPSSEALDAKDTSSEEEVLVPHLSNEFIHEISDALDWGDDDHVKNLIAPLHAADLADLIGALSVTGREHLINIIRSSLDPEILTFLSDSVRDQVIHQIGIQELSQALRELESDDALSIIECLEPDQQRAVLKSIPASERANIEQVLSYPEDSAGRLMQQEIVAVPPFWTVQQTLKYLHTADDLPETFYDLYVVDSRYNFLGAVSLNRIIRAEDTIKLSDTIEEKLKPILVTMGQKEVAYLFRHYNLVSAPVVDETGRLLGIITADDMVHIVEEETERDVLMLAGVGSTDFQTPLFETFYRRVGWLSITLIDALLTTTVISQFTQSIEKMVVLAVLMPVVAAMGGNAGMQAITVTVRAIATRELYGQNTRRAVIKESLIGCLNGGFFAFVLVIVAIGYFQDFSLAAVLASAMVFNMLWAAVAGVALPLFIVKLGFDPAVASVPILVATTDILGYASFLGLSTIFLL